MAFKVWIGNVAIECETAADALELAKQAEGVAVPATKRPGSKAIDLFASQGESRWTEKRAKDFFALIEGAQKKVIDTLLANTEGKTDEQLRRLLSLSTGRALGGVMAGATKNAKKVGADPNDLFVKKKVLIDGKKQKEYFLTISFRNAASQVQQ
jgi:hypothetical protein